MISRWCRGTEWLPMWSAPKGPIDDQGVGPNVWAIILMPGDGPIVEQAAWSDEDQFWRFWSDDGTDAVQPVAWQPCDRPTIDSAILAYIQDPSFNPEDWN